MVTANRKRIASLLFSVLAIAGVLYWIGGPGALRRVLAEPRPGLLAGACLLFLLDRTLIAYKWNRLLAARGMRLRLWRVMQIYATANLTGLFVPSSVGPDALRTLLAGREDLPLNGVLASVALERALRFLSLLGFCLVAVEVLRAEGRFADLSLVADLLALGLVAGVALLLLTFSQRFYRWLDRALPGRVRARIAALHAAYLAYAAMPRILLLFLGLTLLEQSLMLTFNWLLFGALGVHLTADTVFGVLPLTVLFARLPVGGDALGVYEAAFAGLMSIAGIVPAVSVVVALSARVVRVVMLSPLLLSYGWRRARAAAQAGAGAPEAPAASIIPQRNTGTP